MGEAMRSRKVVLGVVTVAVLVVIGVANIGGAGAQSKAVGRWGRVEGRTADVASSAEAAPAAAASFVLIEEVGQGTFVDTGPKGDSEGDYALFRDRLRDPKNNALIGALSVQCVFQFAFTAECHGTAILFDRGKLTFAGNVPTASVFALAITGGTGEFRAARGEVFVHDSPGPRDRIGVHLV
jgi:hypothetical protein